jgi:acyl dehydratase
MKFADFTEGMVADTTTFSLHEQSIIDFAREHDPQWFHVDLQACAEGPYGGLIASGWQTACLAMRKAVDHFLHDSESFGSPGLAYLKWLAPVRPGDALRLHVTVLEKRLSSKNPALGVMRWRWQVFNQKDVCVLDLEATSLFDLTRS